MALGDVAQLRHPDLTEVQMAYARAEPGLVFAYRRTPKRKPSDTMVIVDLPEISEPKVLTRQRLVLGVLNHARRHRTSDRVLSWLVECCWTQDLVIVERGLTSRLMGVVIPSRAAT